MAKKPMMNDQDIKSGNNSTNYLAGRDVSVHHGNVLNTLAQSRLAQIAAVMTVIGTIIAILQYVAILPVNAKIESPQLYFRTGYSLGHEVGSVKNSFAYRFENGGPDSINNLTWYAWFDGSSIDVSKYIRGEASLVAPGSIYYAKNITSPEIKSISDFDFINKKIKNWGVCMIFDGKIPGVRQWIAMTDKRDDTDTINNILEDTGSHMVISSTGSGIAIGDRPCKFL